MKSFKIALLFALMIAGVACADGVFKLGMIGLDTSHAYKFTQIINDPANNYGMKVLYAYKGGSPIEISTSRIDKFTKIMTDELGVQLVDSIEDLCTKVDGVLLESVDGRQHLEQIKPVLAAKKIVYVDKPMAGNLADTIEIFNLAKEAGVPIWSSSCLRFGENTLAAKNNPEVGDINGCAVYGKCPIGQFSGDLYYYGIHSVEALFTMMGPGLKTVTRVHTPDTDIVVGVWKDGRVGTYRGMRKKETGWGGIAFGSKSIVPCGEDSNYEPLCKEIVKFFKTRVSPVNPQETIEIFAFMTAADKSKLLNGATIDIDALIKENTNTTLKYVP